MHYYLINFFLAVFGCVLTVSALWSVWLMKNIIGPKYRFICYILAGNLTYIISVIVEAASAGADGTGAHILMYISNYAEYTALYAISAMVALYQLHLIRLSGTEKPLTVRIMYLYMVPILLLVVSIFNHMYFYIDEDNYYHFGKMYLLGQLMGMEGQLLNLYLLIRNGRNYHKAERETFLYFWLVPIIAMVFRIQWYVKFMIVAITLCCVQMIMYVMQVSRQEYRNRLLELERVRSTMTYTQLHPHFLYNSLSGIAQLCKEDPGRASAVSDQLSEFLRKSTNDMNQIGLKSFDEELEHTKNYLDIDGMRYGEDLIVEYDISTRGFQMPVFVLQQMVEVLIKYDFSRSEGESTIRISSCRQEDDNVITVSCQGGPGLDLTPSEVKNFNNWMPEDGDLEIEDSTGPKHPDLHILEQIHIRLSMIPGSDLTVTIDPGHGTTLTVYLPEENRQQEEP